MVKISRNLKNLNLGLNTVLNGDLYKGLILGLNLKNYMAIFVIFMQLFLGFKVVAMEQAYKSTTMYTHTEHTAPLFSDLSLGDVIEVIIEVPMTSVKVDKMHGLTAYTTLNGFISLTIKVNGQVRGLPFDVGIAGSTPKGNKMVIVPDPKMGNQPDIRYFVLNLWTNEGANSKNIELDLTRDPNVTPNSLLNIKLDQVAVTALFAETNTSMTFKSERRVREVSFGPNESSCQSYLLKKR